MKEIKNIKVRSDMYYDTKFKIIDTKPLRDTIHYVWMRVMTLAGIVNRDGKLYLSENIPYTIETLALEFNRDVEVVKMSLEVLMELEMVILNEHNVYMVKNFIKHQNIKTKKTNTLEVKCDDNEKKESKDICLEENIEKTQEKEIVSDENRKNSNECSIQLINNNDANKKNQTENKTNVRGIGSEQKNFAFNVNSNEGKKTQEQKRNNNRKRKRKAEEINMDEDDKYIVKILDEPDIRDGDRIISSWSF